MQITLNADTYFAVAQAQSKGEARYYIECVLIEKIDAENVRLVATNGHFMFICSTKASMADDWPASVAVSVQKKLAGQSLTIDLAKGTAETAKGKVIAENLADQDLQFPDYRRVVPQGAKDMLQGQISANADYVALVAKFLSHARTPGTPTFYGTDHESPMIAKNDDMKRIAVLMPMRRQRNEPDSIEVAL